MPDRDPEQKAMDSLDVPAIEVAPGILRIEAPLGERVNALYLLGSGERLLLFDTGTTPDPARTLAPALRARGIDPSSLRSVIVSHADVDHMGGDHAVRELAPGATHMCGEPDRAWIEDVERLIAERYGEFGPDHAIPLEAGMAEWCRAVARDARIDMGLVGGERLRLDDGWVEVLATPGHSPGSVSVWDPSSRALLIGDAMLGAFVPTADGRPAFPPTYRHVDDYLATIDRIERLAPDVLLASHEPVMRAPAVAEAVEISRGFVSALDDAVLAALGRARWSLADLALELGPRMGAWPEEAHPLLRFPLLGHLERLVESGRARAGREADRLVYESA